MTGASLWLGPGNKYTKRVCLRSKRSRTSRTKYRAARRSFRIQDARKMGREQKGRGWGRGKKGTLARKPLYSEKPVRPRTRLLIGAAWFI